MATIRVLPPRNGDRPTITINGRVYTCAQGGFLDLPDFDAAVAAANDWTICGKTSGTTANRPSRPNRGDTHFDNTLGYIVVFDGLAWRNPATGGERLMRLFASLSKVEEQDDGSLKVFGVASSGARDDAGEIITPEAMKAAIPGYLRYGAVREMHQPSAAGTALECSVDSDGFTNLTAHIVDPLAVAKVKTGVYKGLSVGGKVLSRDPRDSSIITAIKLQEISLVDRPCNPEASINMWKADMADPQEPAMSQAQPANDQVKKLAQAMADAAGKPTRHVDYLVKARAQLIAELEKAAETPPTVEAEPVADLGADPVSESPSDSLVAKTDPAADLLKAVADLQATLHPTETDAAPLSPVTPGLAEFGKGLAQLLQAQLVQAKPDTLGKGLYGVSRMFEIVDAIVSMQTCSAWEEKAEGDATSTAPTDLAALVAQAGQVALNMAKEELAEALADMQTDMPEMDMSEIDMADFELAAAAIDLVKADTALMEKAGRRNSAKDQAAIQASHDHMVGLGAKCDKANALKSAEPDDLAKVTADYQALQKVVADVAPQIAALREEVAILKAQPLPPKTAGSSLAVVAGVSKTADASGHGGEPSPDLSPEAVQKAFAALPAEDRLRISMAAAMANPIPLRL